MEGGYRPRFGLDSSVIRLPIVPGSDPRAAYGDLVQRGVKGVVLEAFGENKLHCPTCALALVADSVGAASTATQNVDFNACNMTST